MRDSKGKGHNYVFTHKKKPDLLPFASELLNYCKKKKPTDMAVHLAVLYYLSNNINQSF